MKEGTLEGFVPAPYVSKYVKTAPALVTSERFHDMLEVLPPSRWYRGDFAEWFHVCEYLTDDLVSWFGRTGDLYWEFQDSARLTKEQVAHLLTNALEKHRTEEASKAAAPPV